MILTLAILDFNSDAFVVKYSFATRLNSLERLNISYLLADGV